MRAIQNWLDRFCHKHPKLGIPNLMLYIVIGGVIVLLLDMFSMGTYTASMYFSFSRSAILHGQIWRILTFIFVPYGSNFFFVAISLYFYYFVGTMLEREWGATKFTVFYFFGVILNILVGFLVGSTSIFYVNMALFFAFATLYPNMQVLFFFILPIKVKWLAWLNAAFFAVQIFQTLFSNAPLYALVPIAAILNYLLFFGGDLLDILRRMGGSSRHRARSSRKTVDFQAAQQHVKDKKGYLHKCAVCGRTDMTNPELEFRYCSKCNGYYCYCSDHITSHVHIE